MAPVDNSPTENMGAFDFIYSIKANDTIPVHIYKSRDTGITVCIADVEGPVVNGYFCLATEAHDDDGLPHTLEHLIFLGSEDYPYKGVLDLLANRCLASGTNAATQIDCTFYTMTTAGSEGFLSLMPIYLNHIFYPMLTDASFLTEVHHINAEGEDAGVVYCEMQGKENIGEYLVYVELSRAIFPGRCGYKSIVGGALKNLRESTTNEKVRQYHQEFYRPENLTIVITGQVKHADVFKALQIIEKKIISKGNRGFFKKPWQDSVPAFTQSVDLDVYYPCDDEDNGIVDVGWRGPSPTTEMYDLIGCTLLLKYLTDTSVSPVQKEFVEIDDAYASNVGYSYCKYTVSVLYLAFESVPKSKIPLVQYQLLKVLNDVYKKGIDMKRIRTVVHRRILEVLSSLENEPHDTIAHMLFGYALYGNTKEDLDQRTNQIQTLKKFETEPESYWLNLLKTYFLDSPFVLVKGIPSLKKRHELTEKEKNRVVKQIKNLGKEGLQQKEKELQEAIAKNDIPVPDEILSSVPIPSTQHINFHYIKSYTTETNKQHSRFDISKLPFYTYLDHVNTNFVYMFVIMNTADVKKEYKPYIPLLLELLMECPVMRNNQLIPYEEIVAELEADTISNDTSLGVTSSLRFSCGPYSYTALLMLHLEMEKYEKGVQWIKELLYETKLTPDRLKITATKIVNDVAQFKRQGNKVVNDLMQGLIYKKESNQFVSSILRQQKFLNNILERLNDETGQKEIISEIESVREVLTTPKNMVLYMATNVDKLTAQVPNVYSPWNTYFSTFDTSSKTKLEAIPDSTLINSPDEIPFKGCVTGLGCIESSYLCQSCPCINDYHNLDLAPLLVCIKYLTQLEGPMWRFIRGQGLSYGYYIYPRPNEGLLYLSFFKSTNIVAAYKEAKSIVEIHIFENKWEKLLFESAKSCLIFEIIEKEHTVGDLVQQSLLSYFKNVPHGYTQQMVQRVSEVTIEDMGRIASQYLKPLFDPKQCKTTIVCHSSKVPEIVDAFKTLNHDLKSYNTLEESYLNDW
ncbi:hypothetical protein E2986_02562 [Frieseomelitta varia]|uniref:Peptidase M16 C-terminal domain-containing protein n=1 Tax=Frieseomelitta varia TaxID=561572 RepID=A0A833S6U2_9HYME|nr:uncharacterized protein C05D11.1-like [Frieseomelitta varia]KAF3427311.1 hypothetical protein E2986_02562 [Frieseomelitta varia]